MRSGQPLASVKLSALWSDGERQTAVQSQEPQREHSRGHRGVGLGGKQPLRHANAGRAKVLEHSLKVEPHIDTDTYPERTVVRLLVTKDGVE